MTTPHPTTAAGTVTFRCATASVTLTTAIAGVLDEARKILYSYGEFPGSDGTWQVHLNQDPDVVTNPDAHTDGDEFNIGPQTYAYRHDGLWLTVNTPKELRAAQEHVAAHPEWLA